MSSARERRPPIDQSFGRAISRQAKGIGVYIVGGVFVFAAAAALIAAVFPGQPIAQHVGFAAVAVVLLLPAGWLFWRGRHLFADPWRDYSEERR